MAHVVTVFKKGEKQTVYVTSGTDGVPKWSQLSTIENVPFNFDISRKSTICNMVSKRIVRNKSSEIYVMQITLDDAQAIMHTEILREVQNSDGYRSFIHHQNPTDRVIESNVTNTARYNLQLATDRGDRVFVLASSDKSNSLFVHSSQDLGWTKLSLPPVFRQGTLLLTPDAILVSPSICVSGNCKTRQILDLLNCGAVETSGFFAPYSITSSQYHAKNLETTDDNFEKNDTVIHLDVYGNDNLRNSDKQQISILQVGQTYSIKCLPETQITATKIIKDTLKTENLPKKNDLCVITVRDETSRIQMPEPIIVDVGNDLSIIRTKPREFLLIDKITSEVTRICEIKNGKLGVRTIDSHSDLVDFNNAGTIVQIKHSEKLFYVLAARYDSVGDKIVSLWSLDLKHPKVIIVQISLKLAPADFVPFINIHPFGTFVTAPPRKACFGGFLNDARIFTCSCAGEFKERVDDFRHADCFANVKAHFKPQWDALYGRNEDTVDPKIEPAVEDKCPISAKVIYCIHA